MNRQILLSFPLAFVFVSCVHPSEKYYARSLNGEFGVSYSSRWTDLVRNPQINYYYLSREGVQIGFELEVIKNARAERVASKIANSNFEIADFNVPQPGKFDVVHSEYPRPGYYEILRSGEISPMNDNRVVAQFKNNVVIIKYVIMLNDAGIDKNLIERIRADFLTETFSCLSTHIVDKSVSSS